LHRRIQFRSFLQGFFCPRAPLLSLPEVSGNSAAVILLDIVPELPLGISGNVFV